ncbi:bifunctional tryptophan synthase trp1 [Xylographa opegraphella]|nr:bifunctional tryptophan synthase trp1 [Xylographa opegraphella]
MTSAGLIDHSPYQPSPSAKLPNASNLVLIDNYDSFTWNVYQYLVLEGATVTVYRNDEISLEQLIEHRPTQLVVSPGPGHPDSDAGISCEAIAHFSGKIPVLGVCMGEQCIFKVFGGRVDVTGEVLHGKTSPLRHDDKGVYEGLPQDLPVTRYHSLAGTHATLPDCLELSSWIASGPDGDKGIIMGVRHKTFLVEGVQFHPESILTAEGRSMLKNFLHMHGGTWAENAAVQSQMSTRLHDKTSGVSSEEGKADTKVNGVGGKESILVKIYRRRRQAVEAQKKIPSQRFSDLQELYNLGLSPPQVSFPDRLRSSPHSLSLMAEIKRASPSKGPIAMHTCAPAQARKYAMAGASVISVLTEPEWFKGSIDDLRAVRQSLEGLKYRPAVLRKEFIFDEYQILEARLAGADTILLIVKMLDSSTLERLYAYSQTLGMEPLVEVNNIEEMEIAVKLGAKVIGVNNRNLTSFEVDLGTTSRLMDKVSSSTIVCALSGISGPEDVRAYKSHGVRGVLVGEALMRSSNVNIFVSNLLGSSTERSDTNVRSGMLVKICGTRTPEAARVAIEAGADMVGIVLVEGRSRYVKPEVASAISEVVHQTIRPQKFQDLGTLHSGVSKAVEHFVHTAGYFRHPRRALIVGVFQNQSLDYILAQQRLLSLDAVQLHGSEPVEWAALIPVPVIRRFATTDPEVGTRGYHSLPLLDSAVGGTGKSLDMEPVRKLLEQDTGLRVVLAGGLHSGNVVDMLEELRGVKGQVVAVDVSSGVEHECSQSHEKIQNFIGAAKAIS